MNRLVSQKVGANHSQSTLLAQVSSGLAAVESEAVHVLYSQVHWVATARVANEVLYADSIVADSDMNDYVAQQTKQLNGRLVDQATKSWPSQSCFRPNKQTGQIAQYMQQQGPSNGPEDISSFP